MSCTRISKCLIRIQIETRGNRLRLDLIEVEISRNLVLELVVPGLVVQELLVPEIPDQRARLRSGAGSVMSRASVPRGATGAL